DHRLPARAQELRDVRPHGKGERLRGARVARSAAPARDERRPARERRPHVRPQIGGGVPSSGIFTTKRDPSPSWLSTAIVPPWSSISRRALASPIPVPGIPVTFDARPNQAKI